MQPTLPGKSCPQQEHGQGLLSGGSEAGFWLRDSRVAGRHFPNTREWTRTVRTPGPLGLPHCLPSAQSEDSFLQTRPAQEGNNDLSTTPSGSGLQKWNRAISLPPWTQADDQCWLQQHVYKQRFKKNKPRRKGKRLRRNEPCRENNIKKGQHTQRHKRLFCLSENSKDLLNAKDMVEMTTTTEGQRAKGKEVCRK